MKIFKSLLVLLLTSGLAWSDVGSIDGTPIENISAIEETPIENISAFEGEPVAPPVVGDCPTWCDPSYPVCWDGGAPQGQDYACVLGVARQATTNTGTFTGSGADTAWVHDDTTDQMIWPLSDPTDLDLDAGPYTMCMELQISPLTASPHVTEYFASGINRWAIRIHSSNRVDMRWSTAGVGVTSSSGSIADDGATWNIVGGTWEIGGTPDLGASNDGIAWSTSNLGIGNWSGSTISFARQSYAADSVLYSIRKYILLPGLSQNCSTIFGN